MIEEPIRSGRQARKILVKEWLKVIAVYCGWYGGMHLFFYPFAVLIQKVGERKVGETAGGLPPIDLPLGFYRTILDVLSLIVLFFIGYTIRNLWKRRPVTTLHLVLLTIALSIGALLWCALLFNAHFLLPLLMK